MTETNETVSPSSDHESLFPLPSPALFRVMERRHPVVVFRMELDGTHMPMLPAGKSLEEAWPEYAAVASFLAAWFEQFIGENLIGEGGRPVYPGDSLYPRTLAHDLTRSRMMKLWAYVTPIAVWVSFRQVAHALGRQPLPGLRQEMESKGIQFLPNYGHYLAALETVSDTLGASVADQIILYPHQVAGYLGVVPKVATRIVRRFGLAISRNDMTVVPWGRLRRLHRVGPRSFELSNDNIKG